MYADEYDLDREENESTSFLQPHDALATDEVTSPDKNPPPEKKTSNTFIIYITFLGVFIAAIDESLVISTFSSIASQFHQLASGTWLVVAYNFGYCLSLPVCGALSDCYGRKNVLVVSYFSFMLACLACGASTSLLQLVIARVFAGLSGAGMVSLVSIILMDIVPAHEVAVYRSYENVVNSVGRSIGAPLGGLLLDTIGWRWFFIGQVPFILLCSIAALYSLPGPTENENEKLQQSSIRNIDFAGIISFAATIFTLISLLQEIGMNDDNPAVGGWTLAVAFVISSSVFVATEIFWARNPLIPMHLLVQELGVYCLIQVLIFSARSAIVSNIAPYFIRVMNSGDFLASAAYNMIAVGTSLGCIVSAFVIKHTRRYKNMTIISICVLVLSYFLIFLAWRDRCTWQSIILLQVGVAQGFLFSSIFVGMSQSSPKEFSAICVGTYFLSQQLGIIIGPTCGLALIQWLFQGNLTNKMGDIPHKLQVINDVLNDSRFSSTLPENLQKIVRSSYLASFQYLPVFCMVLNLVTLPIFIALKEEKVE